MKDNKNTLTHINPRVLLIFCTILFVLIIAMVTLVLVIINISNKPIQEVGYYCKINEQRLNNVFCTNNNDCWGAGAICDTSLYKCVILGAGQICKDINGTNCSDIGGGVTLPIPNNEHDCEKIGGNWRLRIE